MNKFKTFLILYGLCVVVMFCFYLISSDFKFSAELFFVSFFTGGFLLFVPYLVGFNKIIENYFDHISYLEQDEANFQRDLRREVQRKRALAQVDNENLHYQNQLRIEYIAKVAYIHLQSNKELANMYQQAIISNSTNQETTAEKQLIEIEAELKRQGLI